jgi:uncharacterized protein YegP (UPF0339 family)
MKIEVFQRKGQWYWRLRARNGKSIAIGGEGYKRPQKALASLWKIMAGMAAATVTIYGEPVIFAGTEDEFVHEAMNVIRG